MRPGRTDELLLLPTRLDDEELLDDGERLLELLELELKADDELDDGMTVLRKGIGAVCSASQRRSDVALYRGICRERAAVCAENEKILQRASAEEWAVRICAGGRPLL
jgi:hypothetical protein